MAIVYTELVPVTRQFEVNLQLSFLIKINTISVKVANLLDLKIHLQKCRISSYLLHLYYFEYIAKRSLY
jgi:hypothetical protein